MKISIAIANRRATRRWQNKKWSWEKVVDMMRETVRTKETYRSYLASSKPAQDEIKDVGGFVGGYLEQGIRSKRTVASRRLVTLDIDDTKLDTDGLMDLVRKEVPYEFVVYSTHKHCFEKPRIRIVIPLDRDVMPDEYEAIARHIAGEVGIDLFDPTTFQPERFMYWPSTSIDGDFVFEHNFLGDVCSADDILSEYQDWTDISAWPRVATETPTLATESKKLGDPGEKEGVVGAFCRAYTIADAIDTFLPQVYEETGSGRYSFLEGSGANGGVVYGGGVFFYSNHATDPAGGQLNNAFDLVRIHKFGGLDKDPAAPMNKRESFSAMLALATQDKAVLEELEAVKSLNEDAVYSDFEEESEADFLAGILNDPDDLLKGNLDGVDVVNAAPDFFMPPAKESLGRIDRENWKDSLTRVKKTGDIKPEISNLKLIIIFDEHLYGKIRFNEFENYIFVTGMLPWNSSTKLRRWEDSDESGLREFLESRYSLYHVSKIVDALILAAYFNRFHPIREYLNRVEWDGTPRLDRLLIDGMGAEDTPFVRLATRKSFVGAVARVMKPGCKMDYVLTLVGSEGLKKSSLLAEMGGRWFSDSFTTVDGSKAFEQLQGSWIIEIAELSAFNRSETNAIKAFLTKRYDKYRPAYGRNTLDLARQCVFFATTNENGFLKGDTGNRRFWPVEVTKKFDSEKITIRPSNGAEPVIGLPVDQLWAEAKKYYEQGEPLYMDDEVEKLAKQQQDAFTEDNAWRSSIEEFLDTPVPMSWEDMSRFERREFLVDPVQKPGEVYMARNYVCLKEIGVECLGLELKDLNTYKLREISSMMNRIPGWVRNTSSKRRFGSYGKCRFYEREAKVEELC